MLRYRWRGATYRNLEPPIRLRGRHTLTSIGFNLFLFQQQYGADVLSSTGDCAKLIGLSAQSMLSVGSTLLQSFDLIT